MPDNNPNNEVDMADVPPAEQLAAVNELIAATQQDGEPRYTTYEAFLSAKVRGVGGRLIPGGNLEWTFKICQELGIVDANFQIVMVPREVFAGLVANKPEGVTLEEVREAMKALKRPNNSHSDQRQKAARIDSSGNRSQKEKEEWTPDKEGYRNHKWFQWCIANQWCRKCGTPREKGEDHTCVPYDDKEFRSANIPPLATKMLKDGDSALVMPGASSQGSRGGGRGGRGGRGGPRG